MKNLVKILLALAVALTLLHISKSPKALDPAKDIAPHVVPYRILSLNNKRFATGFYLKYKGKNFILTNRHVCDHSIEQNNSLKIQFGDRIEDIIEIDDLHDLCLVTSDRSEGLELADNFAKPLDEVFLVGFPRGMGKVIREGRVISYMDIMAPWLDNSVVETIRISTIAYGGNSGSPVTNKEGKVVGVLFAGNGYHTEAYVVPLYHIISFLNEHAK